MKVFENISQSKFNSLMKELKIYKDGFFSKKEENNRDFNPRSSLKSFEDIGE